MATLDDLLAKLPDNDQGLIDATDLRDVVTGLWDYTEQVQRDLNDAVVQAAAAVQATVPRVGQVASDGTLVGGPAGWSASYDAGTGLYTVNHDIGDENYAVVITPLTKTIDGWAAAVDSTTPTSFTYGIWSSQHDGLHGSYANFVVGLLT